MRACGVHAVCMRCACGVHTVCVFCACGVHTVCMFCVRCVHVVCVFVRESCANKACRTLQQVNHPCHCTQVAALLEAAGADSAKAMAEAEEKLAAKVRGPGGS